MKHSFFSECLAGVFSRRRRDMVILYGLLQVVVTAILLYSVLYGRYDNAGFCALTLLLFLLPDILARKLQVFLSAATEALFLLFVFAAEILGELGHFYLRFPNWDTLLHMTGGLLAAALGFSVNDILNRSGVPYSPLFCMAAAFCFSMTLGVFWEFFEFGMDALFHTNMQKDTVFYLDGLPCLDIGLYDTMGDLLVHFLSTAVLCVLGYFHLWTNNRCKLAGLFLPAMTKPQ